MPTIVEYADAKVPLNRYPHRIISPSHAGPCCFSDTEEIGPEAHGDHWVYRYKRCRACGFTVRVVLRAIPDAALLTSVRKVLSTTFQRRGPNRESVKKSGGCTGVNRQGGGDARALEERSKRFRVLRGGLPSPHERGSSPTAETRCD
jgi:hypothetical protein